MRELATETGDVPIGRSYQVEERIQTVPNQPAGEPVR